MEAGKSETQGGVEVIVLSPKFVGHVGRLETQAGFLCYAFEADICSSLGHLSFALKAFYSLDETHPQ